MINECDSNISEEHHTYAKFWKCALQVNPYSYRRKFRGQDSGFDPQNYAEELCKACTDEGIKVVGFANHGNVSDAEGARKILSESGIVVFPGFEVTTTEKVHWVCLFSENTSEQELERYLGKLSLTNPEDGIRPSALGGQKLLQEVENLGGFCYAAHVTSNSGVLKGRFNNLWTDVRLRAAQIPGNIEELPPEYKQIILNKNHDYHREYPVAAINAKDIATPKDLCNSSATTFIKMTRPCFASFLIAFKDPASRVRLSGNMIERYYSHIDSICIEGGFFDGLSAEVSAHLNTVIGGRGTGKSTFLECIQYALDVTHKGEDAGRQGQQIVKENLGRSGGRIILKLHSASNHMKPYTVIRRFGEPPRVIDEQGNESLLHPGRDLLPRVEIYGQNEIYELAKNPISLTRIIDRFLSDTVALQSQLDRSFRQLKDNGNKLVKYSELKDELEQKIANLPKLEEQVRLFNDLGFENKLKIVPLLEKQRQLLKRIMEETKRVHSGKRELEESLPDLVFLDDSILEELPHADLFRRARSTLKTFGGTMRQILEQIDKAVEKTESELNLMSQELIRKMRDSESQIDRDFAKLPRVGGKDGNEIGLTYQQLLREIEQVSPAREKLHSVNKLVKELEQGRRNILGEISDLRTKRIKAKRVAVKKINDRLKGKLRVTLIPDSLRKPLRDFLQEIPGIGQGRTQWVDDAQDLTVLGLVAAIRDSKEALCEKGWGLTAGLAELLIKCTNSQLYELESIDLQERIKIELNISHDGENYRSLDQLSTGQQCTAILHLLMLDNQDPLIMDQPEDNLDNAFIAERIVQELRSAKTERQFLFATHNANIPVFGDAEWIGVCTVSGDQAQMPKNEQGSIDIPSIRDKAAGILEGGKEAFTQRRKKYGFDY